MAEYFGCPDNNAVRDGNGELHACGFENRLYCGACCNAERAYLDFVEPALARMEEEGL
jgi:hypothetical protein